MLTALLILFAPVAQDRPDPKQEVDRRDAIIATCHIAARRLVIQPGDDPNYDYDLLVLKGSEPLSDAQLRCYGDELVKISGFWPQIEDEALGDRYNLVVRRDRMRDARADLRQRGVLTKLPHFDPEHGNLKAFAMQLEQLCGAAPHSALFAWDGWIDLVDAPDDQSFEDLEHGMCAINAAVVAGYDPFDRPIPQIDPAPVPSP